MSLDANEHRRSSRPPGNPAQRGRSARAAKSAAAVLDRELDRAVVAGREVDPLGGLERSVVTDLAHAVRGRLEHGAADARADHDRMARVKSRSRAAEDERKHAHARRHDEALRRRSHNRPAKAPSGASCREA